MEKQPKMAETEEWASDEWFLENEWMDWVASCRVNPDDID